MKFILFYIIFLILICNSVVAQQNISDSIEHQGYQRQYIVHLPPGYSGNTSVPVVFVLHGGSGNYQSVQGFTEMNFVSNQNSFIAVYPQGYGVAPPGYSWADGRGTSADDANIDDVGFITKLLDTLNVDYAIDTNKLYVCGYSNGGFMTQRLACEVPERFAAIGGLGCSIDTNLIQTCAPSQPVPMAYFSGTADPEVPYNGGAMNNPAVTPVIPVETAVQFWVDNNNCETTEPVVNLPDLVQTDNSTVEFYKYTDCDCNADFYFYKIINGGHTWPGVPVPQYPQLGNTNEDIHGSYELWDFFSQFSKCNSLMIDGEELERAKINVYPNPTTGTLYVESSLSIKTIRLIDCSGKILSEGTYKQVNMTGFDSGIYFLNVQFHNDELEMIKVIKN